MSLTSEERTIMVNLEFEKAVRFYSQLQTMREKADYNSAWQTTEEIMQPLMDPAITMIEKIRIRVQSIVIRGVECKVIKR